MIAIQQRIDFIKKSHLFRGLKDEELLAVAEKLEEHTYKPDEVIVKQGAEGDRFYLIHSGRVRITRIQGGKSRELAALSSADYFGEDSLLRHQHRSATVSAIEDTVVLSLSRENFHELVKKIRGLRARFDVTVSSHKLARSRQFKWLENGEVVYFITRKHMIELYRSLFWPVLGAILVPLILLYLYYLTNSFIPLWAAIALLVYLAGLIVWRAIDWSNDYYIVTNRRVVWLEKVIGLYDSRQESPLTAVLSVNSETDVNGRLLGYGDVIIRTFVGKVVFNTIGYPEEVVTLVREYWERTRETAKRSNMDAMKTAIRQKLGLVEPGAAPPPPPPAPTKKKLAMVKAANANLFKTRFEEKGSVTYRKHWIVLAKQVWMPTILGIGLLVWLGYLLVSTNFKEITFSIALFIIFLGMLIWWVYQFVDWSNDIFQVTSDQILDIDKTPFGKIKKNVAPLDNILTTEARREGLWENLFNYGNVYISVGGTQMVFEDVMDPPSVQQDIDRRRVARKDKQEADRVAAERDRLAEFFALYHTNAEEFRRDLDAKKQQPPPSDKQPGQS